MPRSDPNKYKCLTCSNTFRNQNQRNSHNAYHKNHVLEDLPEPSQQSPSVFKETNAGSTTCNDSNINMSSVQRKSMTPAQALSKLLRSQNTMHENMMKLTDLCENKIKKLNDLDNLNNDLEELRKTVASLVKILRPLFPRVGQSSCNDEIPLDASSKVNFTRKEQRSLRSMKKRL